MANRIGSQRRNGGVDFAAKGTLEEAVLQPRVQVEANTKKAAE